MTAHGDISLGSFLAFCAEVPQPEVLGEHIPMRKIEVLKTRDYMRAAVFFATQYLDEGFSLDEAIIAYTDFNNAMAAVEPVAIDIDNVTFGQFIDSKMIVSAMEGRNPYESVPYLIAIYRESQGYNPECCNEGSAEFQAALQTPILEAAGWLKGFDSFNKTLAETYTLFQDSGSMQGGSMAEHMKKWGWVRFLKEIAKTKVFDLPGSGMNSVECAKRAKLDDVLVWASEDKDYSEAYASDMEDRIKQNR
jgi:hypothetical protein